MIEKLEAITTEIEYLFQEGAVFTPQERDRIAQAASQLQDLMNDPFLIVR